MLSQFIIFSGVSLLRFPNLARTQLLGRMRPSVRRTFWLEVIEAKNAAERHAANRSLKSTAISRAARLSFWVGGGTCIS